MFKHFARNRWGAAVLTALVGCLVSYGTARAQTPVSDYQFNNTLDSSVGAAQTLTEVGGGDFTFDPAVVNGQTQTVLHIASDSAGSPVNGPEGGVQTPANPTASGSVYTIVLLADFNLDTTNLLATKVFDFSNLTSDAGLYINDATGILAFNNNTMTGPVALGTTAIPTGTFAQIALTRTSTGLVTGYVNGTQDFQFDDSGSLFAAINNRLTVFKDDATGAAANFVNEGTQGDLARLTIFNEVLTPAQIDAIPEPSTWVMLMGGGLMLGVVAARRRMA